MTPRGVTGVEVRPATAADLPAVWAIETAAFADPWSREAFQALLGMPQVAWTVATTSDGTVVGYCILLLAGVEGDVANIATAPGWRGRGVAHQLLAEACRTARRRGGEALFLEVREGNAPARALYARHGFQPVGRRRAYYRDPVEDALVLRRSLTDAGGSPPDAPAVAPSSAVP
jgi:ribosomal-protein-alanine N-acetyltransferase